MKDPKHIKPSVDRAQSFEVDEVPPEEEVSRADAERRADLDPDEQLSRPDQPDFDPDESEQL